MELSITRRPDRRLAALGATVLVHLLLALGWQIGRQLPPPVQADSVRMGLQWITLPAPRPTPQQARPDDAAPVRPSVPPAVPSIAPPPAPRSATPPAVMAPSVPALPAAPAEADAPPATAAAPAPGATLLERARRDVGAIDRALRKENKPLIVAPPDSPMLRLQRGIEHAAEMAPNAWYQAPKTAELVNNTGDGARRTRVITGNGTYCITERAPTTRIDMIEKHGKIRTTNCPEHEEPPKRQEWRTARD